MVENPTLLCATSRKIAGSGVSDRGDSRTMYRAQCRRFDVCHLPAELKRLNYFEHAYLVKSKNALNGLILIRKLTAVEAVANRHQSATLGTAATRNSGET